MICRLYVAIVMLSGVALCTHSLETSGVTETGTVVKGKLVTQSGIPVSSSTVKLVPAGFDPLRDGQRLQVYVDTTDFAGGYTFNDIPAGAYTVQAVNNGERTRVMTGIIYFSEDSAVVPDDTMRTPGSIKMMVSGKFDTVNGYVYIPGTFNYALLRGANGFVVLDSIPAGIVASILSNSSNSSGQPKVVRYNIPVPSGGMAMVANTEWQFSKTIGLNTSPSGAQINGNVYGFPVLLRLTNSDFNFSEAKNNGGDIRFTKQDNAPLACEIERWDSSGEQAEIWVKVDTIFGNDAAHSIIMYWGNPDASGISSSSAVFDTSAGFQGAWHLDAAANTVEKDATIHHYDATPLGKTPPTDTTGIIGMAKKFDGASSYFDMKGTAGGAMNFPEKGQYTLSAWVNVDTLDSTFQALVYKGTYQYGLQIRPENVWEFNEYKDSSWWEGVRYPAVAHAWKYVVSVRSGAAEILYVDGAQVSNTVVITTRVTGIVARSTASDVQLGHSIDGDEGGRYFKGALDEVCVSSVSRSSDWIKLCYMNQRSDDKLLVIK
jgi:Concanavalin A-like lectin/glucanases superfamily/Domain of unknown function (DUF2341)